MRTTYQNNDLTFEMKKLSRATINILKQKIFH